MYLKAGEELTLEALLYGLLLASGNDAAVAIAGFCAGDVDTFVAWMNDKAAELGMEHTHFENPKDVYKRQHQGAGQRGGGPQGAGCRPLRPGEGQGAHSGVPGGQATGPRTEGTDPVSYTHLLWTAA